MARVQAGTGGSHSFTIFARELCFIGIKVLWLNNICLLACSLCHLLLPVAFITYIPVSTLLTLSFPEELIWIPRWTICSKQSFQKLHSGYLKDESCYLGRWHFILGWPKARIHNGAGFWALSTHQRACFGPTANFQLRSEMILTKFGVRDEIAISQSDTHWWPCYEDLNLYFCADQYNSHKSHVATLNEIKGHPGGSGG